MRVCLPGAMSPEFRSKDGTLPGRGVFPRHTKRALARSALTHAPLNGRTFRLGVSLFKPVRACDFRACARRFESVRRQYTFENVLAFNGVSDGSKLSF